MYNNLFDDFDYDSGRLDGEDIQGPGATPDCGDPYDDWEDTPDWKEE